MSCSARLRRSPWRSPTAPASSDRCERRTDGCPVAASLTLTVSAPPFSFDVVDDSNRRQRRLRFRLRAPHRQRRADGTASGDERVRIADGTHPRPGRAAAAQSDVPGRGHSSADACSVLTASRPPQRAGRASPRRGLQPPRITRPGPTRSASSRSRTCRRRVHSERGRHGRRVRPDDGRPRRRRADRRARHRADHQTGRRRALVGRVFLSDGVTPGAASPCTSAATAATAGRLEAVDQTRPTQRAPSRSRAHYRRTATTSSPLTPATGQLGVVHAGIAPRLTTSVSIVLEATGDGRRRRLQRERRAAGWSARSRRPRARADRRQRILPHGWVCPQARDVSKPAIRSRAVADRQRSSSFPARP